MATISRPRRCNRLWRWLRPRHLPLNRWEGPGAVDFAAGMVGVSDLRGDLAALVAVPCAGAGVNRLCKFRPNQAPTIRAQLLPGNLTIGTGLYFRHMANGNGLCTTHPSRYLRWLNV